MAQTLSSIFIHVVFSTKKRMKFLKSHIAQDLYNYIAAIAKSQGSCVHEIGGVEDHVHILLALPRTMALSKLVEEIKKSSSKWIKTKGSDFSDFSWQKGFGGFSIGQSNYENLRHYIRNQHEHHKKITFEDEYRAFLNKYKIEFEEKYLWD